MKAKIDTIKVINTVGMVMGIASTLMTGYAQSKTTEKQLKDLVRKEINKHR